MMSPVLGLSLTENFKQEFPPAFCTALIDFFQCENYHDDSKEASQGTRMSRAIIEPSNDPVTNYEEKNMPILREKAFPFAIFNVIPKF